MSLPAIAQHMAAHGRNGDSMLVHMTPHEVAGLQKLAEKHGTSLTINPHTGLPEAFSLGSLAKAAIPVLAGAALGPAGFGLAETALGAATMVGGVSALASGNLSQGLMAGLGAYGGFGLGAGLAGAGEAALGSEATAANIMNENMALEEAKAAAAQTAKSATPWDKLAAGANSVTGSGGLQALQAGMPAGGPGVMGSSLAAAAPIIADKMTPTTTPMPKQEPSYIRQYSYNPYGQKYTAMTPVDASKWGSRSFEDAFKAADGGIVALAHGGDVQRYADGGVSDAEIKAYVAANQNDPAAIAAAAQQYGVSAADLSRATGYTPEQVGSYFSNAGINFGAAPAATPQTTAVTAPTPVDVNANINNWLLSNPNATYQQMREAAAGSGVTDQQIIDAYNKLGYSAADQNVTMNKDWANAQGQTGYQGLNANINNWLTTNADLISANPSIARRFGVQAMLDSGLNEKDVIRATGKTLAQLFAEKKKETAIPVMALPGISSTPSVAGVSTATPGDIRTNADGTKTVTPNIPGRPDQGFTGMQQVKDVYTTGGGSLGYAPYTPKTAAEHAAMYGVQTGGSKAAYDYLMGQGAYPTTPVTPTGEVMKPYASAVLGMPTDNTAMPYIWDATLRRYVANPKYVKPLTVAEQTAAAEKAKADAAAKEAVNSIQLSAKGGLMGLAGGGMSDLGGYSDGGRLLRGPGDGVSDSIPASIGDKQPARLADGEFVVPARIVSELGNGSTDAGARKLYQMMDRVQKARGKTTGKGKVAANSRADKYLPV